MTTHDPYDAKILRELRMDARLTNLALAARVGLSASACLRRVQALERAGTIAGYRARIDRKTVGRGFLAYVAVGLSSHTKATQEAFERAVAATPQIVECHNVTGTVEYLLRAEVEDLDAYKKLHTDILGALPDVASLTTYVVLSTAKDERG
ncbi:MAG: Lrp/AsnC family transcriptional regulator [Hyphomicrobiales bacterium]|nr:Lrp/AsnC family transcriptional regulator [Hyphomicrobiales bacterium]